MNSKTMAAFRPTALALALLAACVCAPAYAGKACELIDADLVNEDDGGSTATGVNAVSCGIMNTADGNQSVALGFTNDATGNNATAIGILNDALGASSVAIGNTNDAGQNNRNRLSVGTGYQHGQAAIAVGYQRLVDEKSTFSIGGALGGHGRNTVGMGYGFGW